MCCGLSRKGQTCDKLNPKLNLCLILESCAFGRHPWGLWLRSPRLCCGAGPATWSYQEFLSVTPLGVVPCTTLHLENLFAGHTSNPLQKIVSSQTWEPGACREHNWKGSQPLLHELYNSCCESSELSSMFGPQLFPKKTCNIYVFQNCADHVTLTLIANANFQPVFFSS